jgi:hypothetical protein
LWRNWWNEDWQGETEVLGENLPQRHFVHHRSHIDVGGRIISRWLHREIGGDAMDWIHLAQDKDQWRALVIMVMNLRVPWGKFSLD